MYKIDNDDFLNFDLKMVFVDRGEIISGGNFHGEYPAKVRTITTSITDKL